MVHALCVKYTLPKYFIYFVLHRLLAISSLHNHFRDVADTSTLFQRLGGIEGLRTFLWHFYADVRQHQVIGPIFNAKIQNWPEHVAKIAEFWARATGGPSIYAGQMPVKHLTLGLEEKHFQAWLSLWDWNCKRYLGATEAAEMSALAHGIGRRLRMIVGVEPNLDLSLS